MREVMYLMSGRAHCPYLLASLWSLRGYYQGPIKIHAWDDSFGICQKIAEDSVFGDVEVINSNPPMNWKKNKQFGHKILLAQQSKADAVLYLDADTTVHADISPLFDAAEEQGFAATQFNGWMTNGGIVKKRIERLRPFLSPSYCDIIDMLLEEPWPSVNGGVWAASPSSPVLGDWYECTEKARTIFIPDEAVLHIMAAHWGPLGRLKVFLDGEFNMSAKLKFWPEGVRFEDIKILHYHGDSNCRPNKAPQATKFWMSIWKSLKARNVGNVSEWKDTVSNKHLDRLEGELDAKEV